MTVRISILLEKYISTRIDTDTYKLQNFGTIDGEISIIQILRKNNDVIYRMAFDSSSYLSFEISDKNNVTITYCKIHNNANSIHDRIGNNTMNIIDDIISTLTSLNLPAKID